MKTKLILFVILVFFCKAGIAQNPEWIFLSKVSYINTIADEDNCVWVGTNAGIVRINKTTGNRDFFDKSNSPIPDSWITTIAIDNNGIKWFGCRNKACIIKFDNYNWTVYDTSNSPLQTQSIESIAIDKSNNVWVSTNKKGIIWKFDGTNWTVFDTTNSSIPYAECIRLCADGNNIWLVCGEELAMFDGTNLTEYTTSNSNISGKKITKIEKDKNGDIWMLHYSGIEKFDGNTFTFYDITNTNFPNAILYSMSIDDDNIIWTGCPSDNIGFLGGIMSFDGNSWTKYDSNNSPISADGVYCVYADNSSSIWFGDKASDKVGRKNGSTWTNYNPYNSELLGMYVQFIVNDKNNGNAFIGYNSSGVNYDWNNWTTLPYYESGCLGITTDLFGNLYIKNRNGIKKYDGTKCSDVPNCPGLHDMYPNIDRLTAITTDSFGDIWMDYIDRVETIYDPTNGSTYYYSHEGLAHFNGNNWSTYNNLNSPLPDGSINQIKIDKNNHIWIGTDEGLIMFDRSNWTVYNTLNSLIPFNYIQSFTIDTSGYIWLVDDNFGFYKFDFVTSTHYPHPSLYPYYSSGTVETDVDGSVWQMTNFRLIHFDGVNWTTFDANNSPIPDNANTLALSIDKFGNKWLGTQFGVLVHKVGGVIIPEKPTIEKELDIKVYPNPFLDAFELDLGMQLKDVKIKIFDVLGRHIYSANYKQIQKISINRINWRSGVYFYQLKSNNKIISSGKLIAE